jgi:hypothetical protein
LCTVDAIPICVALSTILSLFIVVVALYIVVAVNIVVVLRGRMFGDSSLLISLQQPDVFLRKFLHSPTVKKTGGLSLPDMASLPYSRKQVNIFVV